jgi:hypothetical protein
MTLEDPQGPRLGSVSREVANADQRPVVVV